MAGRITGVDIAVFFDAPAFEDYPFSLEEYRLAYHDLASAVERRGGTLWIVRGQETYRGEQCFEGGWQYSHGTFARGEGNHRYGRIYNKGHFRGDPGIAVINDPRLEELCTNKWETYRLFRKHCPQTELVRSREELPAAAQRLAHCSRIVAKPRDGEEGRGIVIGPLEEVCHLATHFPCVLQEFLNTSAGIPALLEGIHDFRMVVVRGEIMLAFCRTPPPGGLLANVAQGGSIVPVRHLAIPWEAQRLAEDVDAILQEFSQRVYSIDVARVRSGEWKIIELNAKPALFGRNRGEDFARFQEALADLLVAP